MIFSTQAQLNNVLIFIFCGILIGFIYCFFKSIFYAKYQKIFIKNIILCIFYAFFCIFLIILLNFFNFGKFSIVLTSAYYLGFLWVSQLLKKSVVIFGNLWYNTFKKNITKKSLKEKNQTNENPNKS